MAIALVAGVVIRVARIVVALMPVAVACIVRSSAATSTASSRLTRGLPKGVGELFLFNKLLMGDKWSFVVGVCRRNDLLVPV